MKKKNIRLSGFVTLTFILMAGCANQLPPDGGPVDPTPPVIVSVYPPDGTLNYTGNSISIEFEHYVDERTLEESIFISPHVGELEFDWSGTEVEITFTENLRSNTTYVVNIGTDVQDKYRNYARMAKAFALAFSTGPEIDRGGIEGRVFPRISENAMSGVMIFAYRLNGLKPDTLNPAKTNPDFITQTGKNGEFVLYHVPFGDYRIFAVRDEYRNLVYDQGVDEYAVQSGSVKIDSADTLASGLYMRLTKEDFTGPVLAKASAPDRNHVVAEFSKSILEKSISDSSVSIIDTIDLKPLRVRSAFLSPSSLNSIITITDDQDSTKFYRIIIRGITDSVGNSVQLKANYAAFAGSTKPDTLRPRLKSISVKDSTQGIDLSPEITLIFSDALSRKTSASFIKLFDNKNRPVALKSKWSGDCLISVGPEKELQGLTWYTLQVELYGITDWAGRTFKDSTALFHFETLDAEDYASIEGVVNDSSGSKRPERILITADQTGSGKEKKYLTTVDSHSRFVFPRVTEGLYLLQAFVDRNSNSQYDAGKPFPFEYSERLGRLSDTLKVRARWVLEGVNIRLH